MCFVCFTFFLPIYDRSFCVAIMDFVQLVDSVKAQFYACDYSDHLALVRAYDGWKDAERQQSGYEYCWKNFLSAQTIRAIDFLRKLFLYLLNDTGLIDMKTEDCSRLSYDEHLIRAVICAGLPFKNGFEQFHIHGDLWKHHCSCSE